MGMKTWAAMVVVLAGCGSRSETRVIYDNAALNEATEDAVSLAVTVMHIANRPTVYWYDGCRAPVMKPLNVEGACAGSASEDGNVFVRFIGESAPDDRLGLVASDFAPAMWDWRTTEPDAPIGSRLAAISTLRNGLRWR